MGRHRLRGGVHARYLAMPACRASPNCRVIAKSGILSDGRAARRRRDERPALESALPRPLNPGRGGDRGLDIEAATADNAMTAPSRSIAMPTANYLPEVLETTEAERLATGFIFTEGPLWHPDGYWYFVDLRRNKLLRADPRQGAGACPDHDRRKRHDIRPARPADRLRGRRPAPDPHGAGRQGRDAGRQLPRRALQPAERCDLPLERLPLFHRSRQAPPLSRARDTRARREKTICGTAPAFIVWRRTAA